MWIRQTIWRLSAILLTVVAGGLLGATLVRFAPGFGIDEQEMDTRLSRESIAQLRASRAAEENVVQFYWRHLAGVVKGDLGWSRSLQRPIAELFAQRLAVTFQAVALGVLAGWLAGLALTFPAAFFRTPSYEAFANVLSGTSLCLPAAVVALLLFSVPGATAIGIGVVVFPRVFRYARNLLSEVSALPHVLTARAKGLTRTRILFRHILPVAAPQLLALAGVSVSVAFGAAIPIEVICDSPGIGQLAWHAALGRDLPLLINLTVLVTVVTMTANSFSDLAIAASTGDQR